MLQYKSIHALRMIIYIARTLLHVRVLLYCSERANVHDTAVQSVID